MKQTRLKDFSFYEKNMEAEDFDTHAEKALSKLPKIIGRTTLNSEDPPLSLVGKIIMGEKEKMEQGITLAQKARKAIVSPYSRHEFEKAIELFREIPQASALLAICNTDLAAHYHVTNNWSEASIKSREALLLLENMEGLNSTKAFASWIRGSIHLGRGKFALGTQYYNAAKDFYKEVPDSHYFLDRLAQDEIQMRKICRKKNKKWWQLWI